MRNECIAIGRSEKLERGGTSASVSDTRRLMWHSQPFDAAPQLKLDGAFWRIASVI
jgi:hypothetical protein